MRYFLLCTAIIFSISLSINAQTIEDDVIRFKTNEAGVIKFYKNRKPISKKEGKEYLRNYPKVFDIYTRSRDKATFGNILVLGAGFLVIKEFYNKISNDEQLRIQPLLVAFGLISISSGLKWSSNKDLNQAKELYKEAQSAKESSSMNPADKLRHPDINLQH